VSPGRDKTHSHRPGAQCGAAGVPANDRQDREILVRRGCLLPAHHGSWKKDGGPNARMRPPGEGWALRKPESSSNRNPAASVQLGIGGPESDCFRPNPRRKLRRGSRRRSTRCCTGETLRPGRTCRFGSTVSCRVGPNTTGQADDAIEWHVRERARRFLCRRHKLRVSGTGRFGYAEIPGRWEWSTSTRRACHEGPCMLAREARPRAGCGRSASPVR